MTTLLSPEAREFATFIALFVVGHALLWIYAVVLMNMGRSE